MCFMLYLVSSMNHYSFLRSDHTSALFAACTIMSKTWQDEQQTHEVVGVDILFGTVFSCTER